MTDFRKQPSDEELRTALLARLAEDDRLDQAALRVGVLSGIAHLAGQLDSLAAWQAAAEIAASLAGVRAVVNRIEAPGAPSPARIVDLILPEEGRYFEND
ncbi:MAG: BON domain-containing protein [Anaerolineales bacterium]|nr:BON domain-containing protein [Anaerolineales bacterium]